MAEKIRIVNPEYGVFDFYPETDKLIYREEQNKEQEVSFGAFDHGRLMIYPTDYERTIGLSNSTDFDLKVLKYKLDWLKIRYKSETDHNGSYIFRFIEFEDDADYTMFLTVFSNYLQDRADHFATRSNDRKLD